MEESVRKILRVIRTNTYKFIDYFTPNITSRSYLGYELIYSKANGLVERFRFLSPKKEYEPELGEAILDILKNSDGKVFVDIGANIGLISLYVKKFCPESTIICFEPGQYQRALLELTISTNNLESGMIVYPYAISSKNEIGEFSISSASSSNSGDGLLNTKRTQHERKVIPVEMRTLDSIVEQYKIKPNVIKIDIEGAELWALQGMIDTIKRHSPAILFEMNPLNLAVYPYSATDIIDFFIGNNYKISNLEGIECTKNNFSSLAEKDDMFIALPK
jgi:FkbM family methyltransferase